MPSFTWERMPFMLFIVLLITGITVDAVSYDYSATIECLAEPLKPQYGGGILVNPEFRHGLKGWSEFGVAKIERGVTKGGNNFIMARSRSQPYDSLSQKLYLQKEMLYSFSAWIQISEGKAPVTAVFKTVSGFTKAGAVVAEAGCWSMLKGGLTVNVSGPAEVYFESKNTGVEIWVASVSLQPFTQEEWRSHQDESIEKARKIRVQFQAVDSNGTGLKGAKLSISQKRAGFPFGCAIASTILDNAAYQNWFTSRFSSSVTVFENEMKWYSIEKTQGDEDYSVADAMVAFAKTHGLSIRGHNILWDDPHYQLNWVAALGPDQLQAAAQKRINSIVSRYRGQVIGWDVVNENLHFNFFESKLGADAFVRFYQTAHDLDSSTTMFMNEFNTIEDNEDMAAAPCSYIEKLKEIQNQGRTGIGLEGHFETVNLPYMRASLDTLAATGLPIWLTEVDVQNGPNQATYLEQVLREGHAHSGVQGIIVWGAWRPEGCYRMCLTDNNFKNLPTGDVVDKLIGEWKPTNIIGTADDNGLLEISLFHGEYDVTVMHPSKNSSMTHSMKVEPLALKENSFHVKVQV